MWKYQQGTPCPSLAQHTDIFSPPVFVDQQKQAGQNVNANVIDDVFVDYNENTTRNISKLMRNEFKNARLGMPQKPRRTQVQQQAVNVFDEEHVNTALTEGRHAQKEESKSRDGGSIMARKPQKIKPDTSKDGRDRKAVSAMRRSAAHDVSAIDIFSPVNDENATTDENSTTAEIKADNRRRTIWVPSDDTSVLTIHPGAYDQTLGDDTLYPPPQRGLNTKTPKLQPKPRGTGVARHSMSVAPKRATLGALAPAQPNACLNDRVKCMVGKENVPPGVAIFQDGSEKGEGKLGSKPIKAHVQSVRKPLPSVRTSLFSNSDAVSQARAGSIKKRAAPEPRDEPRKAKMPVTRDPRSRLSGETKTLLKHQESKPTASHSLSRPAEKRAAPNKLGASGLKPRVSANLSRYPILADDLVQPELYEDNWLSHQEIALTRLVNSVFQQADAASLLPRDDVASLRSKLLRAYQDAFVVALHKRLKASLVYGALSMPKESKELPRLREDVGLRRQFLDLWTQSYSLDALQAAAEVIIGRAMTSGPRTAASIAQSLGSTSDSTCSAKEREIRRFLLTFLVHHEDAVDPSAQQQKSQRMAGSTEEQTLRVGSQEWFWQRTVLSSLMLVHLLDSAKTSGKISTCLFQASSIRKSSTSILHAFTRMLFPWIGDITRPLGHLDYAVPHTQLPLSEYTYHIDNLAVDFRNGVLLTRLVELLLYPSSNTQSQNHSEQTLTLSLPDGETLTSILSAGNEETWVLSQHLKFPSVGRAQKLHNVQIALSALQDVQGSLTEAAVSSTSAQDIVDGHREKTLSLLWSLVNRWGMGQLVDWAEVKNETRRFAADSLAFDSRLYLDCDNTENNSQQPDASEQAALLKQWAAAICAPHSIQITNLTTSFSSGAALACIVAAYADILPSSLSPKLSTTGTTTLKKTLRTATTVPSNPTADALRALGCSDAFTALFASAGTAVIPSRSTTTALLAFLASRLLPLARTYRAVQVLQRAWRLRRARVEASRRVALMRIACACKEAVYVKKEVLGRVLVLQRAWRGVLEARRQKMDGYVVEFQNVARGWAIRRQLGSAARVGGSVCRRRVMGGW